MSGPTYIDDLESESIHILREVAASFERPVLLYSVGKDSTCLLHLSRKAFHPAPIPFTALHVDTTFKFAEMYAWRDHACREAGVELRVHTQRDGSRLRVNPGEFGLERCCGIWKTRGLLDALAEGGHDASIGGARRDEERSRAKERVFSLRNASGAWDPRRQRPEPWRLYNPRIAPGEHVRVFPLSNWTELDVWRYIDRESVPVVSLYFSARRRVVLRGGQPVPVSARAPARPGEAVEEVMCRFRTLGCVPCTGAVFSSATTVAEVVAELERERTSERATRAIDHDRTGSMEIKKREGYF